MDEFKWLFYVVVAILYFYIKSRNKKAPTQSENSPYEPTEDSRSPKPVTFEDLLREIQSSKAPTPKPEPKPTTLYEPSRYPKYEDYDDKIEAEDKDLEEVGYDYRKHDQIYETYEKAKQAAFNRPSLEETMKVEDTVVRFGHFKVYDQQSTPSLASKFGVELRDAENFRKAFIMSEILNRKY